MPRTQNRAVMIWIFTFTAFAMFLVVYGGFVRLTRSGLSITQWNPVSGAVPPLNQQAWQAQFSLYQQTPEFKLVNYNMTLDQYKTIFWVEWLHRFIARIAGFVFAIPFFVFLFQKNIPWKEVGWYIFLGILFVSQAILGWYMVASGLEDRPSVSHYLLASHMLLALTLIGISLWTAFGHIYGFSVKKAKWSLSSKLVLTGFIMLLIQICYGSFTAGLKAGYISDTWPLILGQLVPSGLLSQLQPPLMNLIAAPLTVLFIHRWFAFVGLITAIFFYWLIQKQNVSKDIKSALNLILTLVITQIVLGILIVLSHVQIAIALIHQANALLLFSATIFLLHRLRAADQSGGYQS
ncbi:MAG: COX15/CtaA family protein [Anaerolineales bacterium]